MKENIFFSITPDPMGLILETGFDKFVSRFFIEGLLRFPEPGKIEILAVVSTMPGHGHFHAFIDALKKEYKTVCIWFDENPILGPMLARYGFHPECDIDGRGEVLRGWRWDAPKEIA